MPIRSTHDSLVLRQPNGLYARWSGMTGSFTHINLDATEMKLLLINRYNVKLNRANAWISSARDHGDKRFWECLKVYEGFYGAVEAKAVENAAKESASSRTLTKAV